MSKAKLLLKNFWVAGYGHFDVTEEEVENILDMVNEGDEAGLDALYERLSKERLG